MKKIRKILCAVLAVAIVFSVMTAANPATAKAADLDAPKKMTVTVPKGYTFSLDIRNIPKGSQIDVTSVKSSDEKVAKIYSVAERAYSKDVEWESYGYAYIYMEATGFGTTKVSYKIDGKKYTTKVTVKEGKGSNSNYTCPVDKFTISGVNSGKNIASKFKKNYYIENAKLGSAQKNGKVNIKAKKGWEIDSIYVINSEEDGSHTLNVYSIKDTTASVDKLVFGKGKGMSNEVQVSFVKGDESVYIWISFS